MKTNKERFAIFANLALVVAGILNVAAADARALPPPPRASIKVSLSGHNYGGTFIIGKTGYVLRNNSTIFIPRFLAGGGKPSFVIQAKGGNIRCEAPDNFAEPTEYRVVANVLRFGGVDRGECKISGSGYVH